MRSSGGGAAAKGKSSGGGASAAPASSSGPVKAVSSSEPTLRASGLSGALAVMAVVEGGAASKGGVAALEAAARSGSEVTAGEAEAIRIAAITKSLETGVRLDDRHPERRVHAAYLKYEETYIARCREEEPGLKLSQMVERCKKDWKKSPLNPMNAEHLSYDHKKGPKGGAGGGGDE